MSAQPKIFVPISQQDLVCLLNTSDLDHTVNCDDPEVLGSSRFSMDPNRLHSEAAWPSAAVRFVPRKFGEKAHSMMKHFWKIVEQEDGLAILSRADEILGAEKRAGRRCIPSQAVRRAYNEVIPGADYESEEQKAAIRGAREQLCDNVKRRCGYDFSHERFDCIETGELRDLLFRPQGYAALLRKYKDQIAAWRETPEWRARELERQNRERRAKGEQPISSLPGEQPQQLYAVPSPAPAPDGPVPSHADVHARAILNSALRKAGVTVTGTEPLADLEDKVAALAAAEPEPPPKPAARRG